MTPNAENPTQLRKKHGMIGRALHWGTALLLAYGYMKGLDDVSQLADPALFMTEITFALILGGAFLARYIWMRLVNGHTRLPGSAPKWEHWLSRYAHLSIYLGVAMIILSGLAIALEFAVPILSGWFLSAAIALHEFSLSATLVLLAAHVAGALWHRIIRHDGVWESMVPLLGARSGKPA